MKTYECKVCSVEVEKGHSKLNVYCSNKCQGQDRLLDSIERAKQGLVNERPTLRKVLAHLHGYNCAVCLISEWNSKPITLQVDHINGLATNNNIENLRLICPNCHSQSSTFGGRNKGQGRAALGIKRS